MSTARGSEQAAAAGAHDRPPDVGRGTLQMLVAGAFLLFSGFGVSVILARALGPAEFGIYGVIIALLGWFERVVSAGVPRAVATLLPQMTGQKGAIESSARLLLLLVATGLFLLLWILAARIAEYLQIDQGTTLIRVAALNLPAMAMLAAYDGIFRGLRLFSLQSLLKILQSAAKLAAIALLLYLGMTVLGALVANLAGTLAALAVVFLRFRADPGAPTVAIMRRMVVLAVPASTYLLALAIMMGLALWQLQASPVHDAGEVGYYVASLHLVRALMIVPAAVSGVLYASMVWAIVAGRPDLERKYLQGAMRFTLLVTAPASAALAVNGSEVMELLYGASYADGGRVLALLGIATGFIAVMDVLFNALMARGRIGAAAGVLSALLPLMYLLNSAWIASDGGVGAAGVALVVFGLGAAIALALVRRCCGPPLQAGTGLRILLATTVLAGVSQVLQWRGPWILAEFAVVGVLYVLVLVATRELTLQDLRPFALWKQDRS